MATTTPQRSGSDAAPPTAFSYAQAAKGLSAPLSSATSKPSSGAATPAKDPQVSTAPAAGPTSWADDAEANDARSEPTTKSHEPRAQSPPTASKALPASQAPTASPLSSPDLGASTASTVTKDDDVSSIPNTSSDSTWDNKSQASTSVEKSVGSIDKPAEKGEGRKGKGKGKNAEKAPAKPLTEAPVPVVNFWKQRAEDAKARTVVRPTPDKPAPVTAAKAPNGVPQESAASAKQTKVTPAVDASSSKEKPPNGEHKAKARDEEKANQLRKDSKLENEAEKAKKNMKGRPQEKESRPTPPVLPLMPARDQEAWPTPETAIDEERKKANEKNEKPEPEHKESSAPKTKWNKLPINPTVVFNTPMPSGASSRRGGRGPGRGGAQVGGRTGGSDASIPPQAEKDGSAAASLPNGDAPKRGRVDGPARDASPKEKRTISAGPVSKDKVPTINGEKFNKKGGAEVESSRRSGDAAASIQPSGQNNTYPRQQYPTNRPGKGRKGDFLGQERRKDGDAVSPTKENGTFTNPTATQAEVTENGELRPSGIPDGQAPYSKRGNDRQYGSYAGRDRPRGGRGGRGNFQNGHQYTNGHNPSLKQSYPGPLSPTAFNPDPNAFFSPTNARYRTGPRSQSVTNENMFRMPGGAYGGPQPVAPIQQYMNGPYDYPLAQPMSALPFGQFGMDPTALFSMVMMQMEYYFSLENLLKDMYLRKHMDAKGFVSLGVIAEFNRIKQLTTDLELIKLVCYQSRLIDFRIGHDGKDMVRCREGWEQWVLPVADRDASAQNEGPEETYNPPVPHPHGYDQNAAPRYPEMPVSAEPVFGNEGPYPTVNGFHPGASQHLTTQKENVPNGTAGEGVNGTVIPNGHPVDHTTKAVSGEPDSFSDGQVESLTVVVRKQDQSVPMRPALLPATIRTFSNGSLDSRSGVPDETSGRTGSSLGVESKNWDEPRRTASPHTSMSETTPVRLYWVKDNDTPVNVVPTDSTHEIYSILRSKALQQRRNTSPGSCPYDMDVLYQFWSHFLIRNYNTRMYDEFRNFAFEDAANLSEVGLSNLIKFYGEALLSSQGIVRERVALDYIELVRSENEHTRPAFKQLQSVMRNKALGPRNRQRISDLLDADLLASLG